MDHAHLILKMWYLRETGTVLNMDAIAWIYHLTMVLKVLMQERFRRQHCVTSTKQERVALMSCQCLQ